MSNYTLLELSETGKHYAILTMMDTPNLSNEERNKSKDQTIEQLKKLKLFKDISIRSHN